MLQSRFAVKGFSLDYMRVGMVRDPLFDVIREKCFALDSDNSNYGIIAFGDFDLVVTRMKDKFLFRPTDFPFEIFRLEFTPDKISRYVTFDFYSSFFRWAEFWRFLTPFRNLPQKITRLDFALDLAGCTPADVEKYVTNRLARSSINNDQTIYFGAYKSNRKIIRVYDKKADTEFKGKSEIFSELENETRPVTRIELELRVAGCRSYKLNINALEDVEYQYHIFYKELTTKYVWFPLVASVGSWFVSPPYEKATPNPVLRFREAIVKAYAKSVDIRGEVERYLKM